eukprot:465413_1
MFREKKLDIQLKTKQGKWSNEYWLIIDTINEKLEANSFICDELSPMLIKNCHCQHCQSEQLQQLQLQNEPVFQEQQRKQQSEQQVAQQRKQQINSILYYCWECDKEQPGTKFSKNQRKKKVKNKNCIQCAHLARFRWCCCKCGEEKPRRMFSKSNKKKKKNKRKCLYCVENGSKYICCQCGEKKELTQFSKNDFQKNKKKRKCLQCDEQNRGMEFTENQCIYFPDNDIKWWFINYVKLPQYVDIFIEEGFEDFETILEVENDDLIAMNITQQEHRLNILQSVKQIKTTQYVVNERKQKSGTEVTENKRVYDMIDIQWWFTNSVKLPQYTHIFIEEGFEDFETILEVENDDLIEMNITQQEHRLKIMQSVKQLKAASYVSQTHPKIFS